MDKVYEEVEELLEYIKQEMEYMNLRAEDVFLNGNCGNLYRILVNQFPKYTTPYLISHKGIPFHLVTGIGEKIYDIRGETSLDDYVEFFINSEEDDTYKKEDFDIRKLSVADEIVRENKMCDQYRYSENGYGEIKIDHLMRHLEQKISKRNPNQR